LIRSLINRLPALTKKKIFSKKTKQLSLVIVASPATHYTTLQHTATHCNTLQHTATHCNTLQHTPSSFGPSVCCVVLFTYHSRSHSIFLSHFLSPDISLCLYLCPSPSLALTLVLALFFFVIFLYLSLRLSGSIFSLPPSFSMADCDIRNTLHHTATHCITLQHTATRYKILQRTATIYLSLPPSLSMADSDVRRIIEKREGIRPNAIHCNTMQHTATHCNTLQHTATIYLSLLPSLSMADSDICRVIKKMEGIRHNTTRCNTLQHTATHCNTLKHNAAHCNRMQHTPTHCNTLQHTATHCNTLQHTAAHCNTLQHTAAISPSLPPSPSMADSDKRRIIKKHCNTLQHTATHCNTHIICVTWQSLSLPPSPPFTDRQWHTQNNRGEEGH